MAEIAPGDLGQRRAFAGARTMIAPNAIIRPSTSFGIMPAPGEASVPNGRSPLMAKTSAPAAMNAPPAT